MKKRNNLSVRLGGQRRRRRRAAAAVEFAAVLPVLLIVFVMAVDFARAYYFAQLVADCARNGAMFEAHPDLIDRTPYLTASEAALAGAGNINPKPQVTVAHKVDSMGKPYAEVKVDFTFKRACNFFVFGDVKLSHTSRCRIFDSGIAE